MNKIARARKYLMSYRKAYEEYTEILEKFARADRTEPQSPKLTGMPRGTETPDLSDVAVMNIELREVYSGRMEKLRERMKAVKKTIESQFFTEDVTLLSYKYIDFMTFAEIGEKMDLDVDAVYKRHQRALLRLPLREADDEWA